MHPLRITRATNDLLFDEAGRAYIDLFTAHGTVWLGHAHPVITAAVTRQLGQVWLTGAIETPVLAEARALVDSFFPPSHRLVALYSTGMEAAEFALRLARVATGKTGALGFERSMHGKSLATACLAWDNHDGVQLPEFVRLPFLPEYREEVILERLAAALARHSVSAVLVEPIQGSGGGYTASPYFFQQVQSLCRRQHALLIFDEILTGFHRAGPAFLFAEIGLLPDVVLIGKSMGNGFPVSAVVAKRDYPVHKAMLPGSTYSGHPLAAAAVSATLEQMKRLDLPGAVSRTAAIVRAGLGSLEEISVPMRGRGAMWFIEIPPALDGAQLVAEIYARGVAVGFAGRYLRLLPAATIEPDHLERACSVIREVFQGLSGDMSWPVTAEPGPSCCSFFPTISASWPTPCTSFWDRNSKPACSCPTGCSR
jgi:acetylornithine/succinyldiaminopimelate/putrescine aminotransferase